MLSCSSLAVPTYFSKMIKTQFFSYRVGRLAKGCAQCVRGRKLVLFITGICHRGCYFCPLSDKRKGKDIIWANERPISPKAKDAIDKVREEITLSGSDGLGITGGDPLLRFNRTLKFIKAFNHMHIHIYVPLCNVTKTRLKQLYEAGLDEIRFHPDLTDDKDWYKIEWAKSFNWKIGIEIPVIPGLETNIKKLILYAKDNIDFINLNELEISDNNHNSLSKLGFVTKDRLSYAIKGSNKLALKLVRFAEKYKLRTHYCTSKLKDAVQLKNRIRIRAKNVKTNRDIITKDGLLMTGVIFADKKSMNKLKKQFKIKSDRISFNRHRIMLHPTELERIYNKIPYKSGLLEFYPTWDRLEVELTILKINKSKN